MSRMHTPSNAMDKYALWLVKSSATMSRKLSQKVHMVNLRKGHNHDTSLPLDDHPHFLEYAAELANVLRSTIFVDQVRTLFHLPA